MVGTRITIARAGWRAGRRRRGHRSQSRSGSPSWAAPPIDRGTNQPNVFFDPKSSESFVPYFSRGWRDDAIQRAYLEATYLWWGEVAKQPAFPQSTAAGWCMSPECAAWTWDARAVPVLSGPDRRLDGRRELAAGALAYRAARSGVFGGAGPGTSACARACPRIVSTSPGSGARSRANGHWRTRVPACVHHHARAAFRLRRGRDRGRDPFRDARPGRGSHSQP